MLLLFFHRFRVNKLYHLWLRDWLCRPIKNPQDSASNYWYFSVLCVQIYGFICLITAGAFSLLCVLVPFRSWLFRRVCFRGFLLIGFLFVRCVFTDIPQLLLSEERCDEHAKIIRTLQHGADPNSAFPNTEFSIDQHRGRETRYFPGLEVISQLKENPWFLMFMTSLRLLETMDFRILKLKYDLFARYSVLIYLSYLNVWCFS